MVQRKSIYSILVAGLLVICLLGAGCTSQPEEGTPTATPTAAETTDVPTVTPTPAATTEYAFNETNDNETVTLPAGSEIAIRLDENPTTGFSWNVTSSAGLEYVNDTYIAPETELVGAGGTHEWRYLAAEKGDAEFSAIYKRPWEETTGNETTFSLAFTIE